MTAGGRRWVEITSIGVGLLGAVGTTVALSEPAAKFWVAGFLIVGALWLGASGLNDLAKTPKAAPTSATPSDQTGSTQNVSLERDENPAALATAGYQRTTYAGRWERDVDDADASFSEKEVILYENGKWLVSGNVYVVLNECAWAPGSERLFQHRSKAACSLETLLEDRKFKERLLLARHLVFVGLESALDAPRPAKDGSVCGHDWLTECRAEELATRVRNAFPETTGSDPVYWTLDIGHAKNTSRNLEWDQRRAVILAIRNRKEGLSVEEAVTRLSTQTRVEEVTFADYSKVDAATAEQIDWERGGGGSRHR